MDKNSWETLLDRDPENWTNRLIYADWLLDHGEISLAQTQTWMVENRKTPGPACVMEAAWHEASWFSESQKGVKWLMQSRQIEIIREEWCLPSIIFNKLKDYFNVGNWLHKNEVGPGERRSAFHLKYAKSWNGRREAETALCKALELSKIMGENPYFTSRNPLIY